MTRYTQRIVGLIQAILMGLPILIGLAWPTASIVQASGTVSHLAADVGGWWTPYCEVRSAAIGCADAGAPQFDPPTTITLPGRDGQALRLAHTGGPGYGNVMYQYKMSNTPQAVDATQFVLDLSFLYRPQTSFNNAGQPSRIQALEFAITRWSGNRHHDWEVQLDVVRGQSGQPATWRIWGGDRWVETGVVASPAANTWHHLVLRGDIRDGQTHYDGFAVDDASYALDQSFPPMTVGGRIVTIHVQLDGPATPQPGGFEVLLADVNVAWDDTAASISGASSASSPTSGIPATTCPGSPADAATIIGGTAQYWEPLSTNAWKYGRGGSAARAPLRNVIVPAGMHLDYWDGQQVQSVSGPAQITTAYEATLYCAP